MLDEGDWKLENVMVAKACEIILRCTSMWWNHARYGELSIFPFL